MAICTGTALLLAISASRTGSDVRAAAESPRAIPTLEIDGVVSPITARYLERGISAAAAEGHDLIIVRLNTPGGTMTSMRDMVMTILGAPIGVAVYVAPAGARAASAGMFVTTAAHVAAMAPGTNIGSAHPVALGQSRDADSVMDEKIVNDAAAMVRAIAAERGRNAAWLERAVRKSVAATAVEAREKRVIDLVARDPHELLTQLDGRRVKTAVGERVLRTAGAILEVRPMRLPERILHTLTDPNIAYILFTLGLIGLAAELYNPGVVVPGVIGVVSMVLAFVAFGSLPVNWGGALLLLLGAGLVVMEMMAPGVGVLGAAGALAFVLGSLILYRPLGPLTPAMPDLRVSPWLLTVSTAVLVAFLVVVGRAVLRTRRAPVRSGAATMVGGTALALSDLAPEGTVRVDSETWSAYAQGDPVPAGEVVRIIAIDGVTLRVAREEGTHAR